MVTMLMILNLICQKRIILKGTHQLYHFVTSHADIKDKNVLEVGSGRGGGASYIARYLSPSSITGVDISNEAVALCSEFYDYLT